jgi:hypothetical protein
LSIAGLSFSGEDNRYLPMTIPLYCHFRGSLLLGVLKNVILFDSFSVDHHLDGFPFGDHTSCWLPTMHRGSSIDFTGERRALATDDFLYNVLIQSIDKEQTAGIYITWSARLREALKLSFLHSRILVCYIQI